MTAGIPGQRPGTECQAWGGMGETSGRGHPEAASRSQGLPGSVTHSSRNVRLFPSSSRSTIQGRQPASGRGWSSAGALHVGQETPQERDGAGTHAPGRLSPNPQEPKDRLATLGASPRPQGAMAPPWLPATGSRWGVRMPPASPPGTESPPTPQQAPQGCWRGDMAQPQCRAAAPVRTTWGRAR